MSRDVFEDFAFWEKLICRRLAAGIPIALFMWTSGLVKVAQTGTDEGWRQQGSTRCKIMVQSFWAVLLTFSYKLIDVRSSHTFSSSTPVCWALKIQVMWHHEAPKMTKDDYLKLAPVGAAFAAGQAWCDKPRCCCWKLLWICCFGLAFGGWPWEHRGGSTNQQWGSTI